MSLNQDCQIAAVAEMPTRTRGSAFLQLRLPLVLLMLVMRWGIRSDVAPAADQKYWELSPYRVQVRLAVDDSQRPQSQLGPALATALRQRIRATLYPLWSTELLLATGRERQRLLTELPQLEKLPGAAVDLEAWAAGHDKQIFLNVVATPLGCLLESREYDCWMRRWSAVQQRQVRQGWMLPAQCLDMLCQTFSPLATIRPLAAAAHQGDKNRDTEMLLRFRGSDLPQQIDLSFLAAAGDVYQPLMARTSTSGEVQTDSIREIPWTYLTLAERQEDGWRSEIQTGTRRPFGVRRRGRIEHFALAIRNPTGATKVRFYARHDPRQGLAGYEVFRREPGAADSQPLGLTNAAGAVELLPGASPVTLLYLRSEGQLLAKVPVVPGAKRLVEVPVADDTARLRAQASLTSLTEQLIDTVAQRNILIARVRDRLKHGQLEAAQQLFSELDSLPGRAQFDQLISSAENRQPNRSGDSKVQAGIEKLFADTRKLLGRFLGTRQITELQGELTAARRN